MPDWENLLNLVFSASIGACVGFTLVSLVCLLTFRPIVPTDKIDQAYGDGFDDGFEEGYDEARRDILGADDDE